MTFLILIILGFVLIIGLISIILVSIYFINDSKKSKRTELIVKYCSCCGSPININSQYCENCGQNIK